MNPPLVTSATNISVGTSFTFSTYSYLDHLITLAARLCRKPAKGVGVVLGRPPAIPEAFVQRITATHRAGDGWSANARTLYGGRRPQPSKEPTRQLRRSPPPGGRRDASRSGWRTHDRDGLVSRPLSTVPPSNPCACRLASATQYQIGDEACGCAVSEIV